MRKVEQKAYNKTYHLSKDWSRQIESEKYDTGTHF